MRLDCATLHTKRTNKMSNNKICYIICGLPGTGKSTLANVLASEYNLATDDYPGLYVEGVYQPKLQKESHAWCLSTFTQWLMESKSPIAVHNTFMLDKYRKPYIDVAVSCGYVVQIINTLGTYVDGNLTQSIHNVPESVVESMSRTFEPIVTYPEQGLNLKDLNLDSLVLPDVIILDMDGTIKTSNFEGEFAQTPQDFKVTSEFIASLPLLRRVPKKYIVSNQQGVKFGHKSLEFLEQEVFNLLKHLQQEYDINILLSCFAIDEKTIFHKTLLNSGEFTSAVPVKKPDKGMLKYLLIVKPQIQKAKQIWYVGDMHSNKHPADYQFAILGKALLPQLKYVPIELLPYLSKKFTK
jgi:histidinol phosphatase-like enzyme